MRTRAGTSMVDPSSGRSPQTFSRHRWLQRWMQFAQILGHLWAWVLLTLFYVLVVLPIGLLARLASDPLRLRPRSPSWQSPSSQYDRLEDATLQS